MTFVYLDTETTGLDPLKHEPWEIAYAVDSGPVLSSFLPLDRFEDAVIEALVIGGFHRRFRAPDAADVLEFDDQLRAALDGATLVGANPAFDAAMLQYGLWETDDRPAPWHYRLLDVEAYAMGALGYSRPKGLNAVALDLVDRGHEIPAPDHTAAGDVATVRACHLALVHIYGTDLYGSQG